MTGRQGGGHQGYVAIMYESMEYEAEGTRGQLLSGGGDLCKLCLNIGQRAEVGTERHKRRIAAFLGGQSRFPSDQE